MGHNVVISKGRDYWHNEVVGWVCIVDVLILAKDFSELGNQELILFNNLLLCPRYLLIIIMSRRIASPYYEIDVVFEVLLDPFECFVD